MLPPSPQGAPAQQAAQPLDFHGAKSVSTIHVISDSLGDTAADVALAAAAQFDNGVVHIERLPRLPRSG